MSNNMKINVIFADGTRRQACISPAALALVRRFAGAMPSLFDGTRFNPLNAECDNIIAITRTDHDALHRVSSSGRKADFRLGQMDMKESIVHMLLDAELAASEELRPGLLSAAEKVLTMEVPYADPRK